MDRRSFQRVSVQMPAEIRISEASDDQKINNTGMYLSGIIETIDMSLGGFSAKVIRSSMDSEKIFTPALAYTLIGKVISIDLTR